MSRSLLTCVLILSLSSVATADRAAAPHFAQPPSHAVAPSGADYEIMRPSPRLDRATVRAALLQQRRANLARFRAYQRKGVFPNNTFSDRKLNVWRDAEGNFCAAATMIKLSGYDELVIQVAEQNNFIRLADVTQGPLMDWMLTSGLTQDEIVAIQEPFMPVAEPAQPRVVDARARMRVPVVDPDELQVSVKLRKLEDARLRAKYRQVERMLVRNENKSIELAIDRLMKHQELAWRIVVRTET
jgi:hypothetical protein